MAAPGPEAIEIAILTLLTERGARSICPSEVARRLAPDKWRQLMRPVREAASRLVAQGEVAVTQKGREVDPLSAFGPIRLRKAVRD